MVFFSKKTFQKHERLLRWFGAVVTRKEYPTLLHKLCGIVFFYTEEKIWTASPFHLQCLYHEMYFL